MMKINFYAGMMSLGLFIWALNWNFEYSTMEYIFYHFVLWINLFVAIININVGMSK